MAVSSLRASLGCVLEELVKELTDMVIGEVVEHVLSLALTADELGVEEDLQPLRDGGHRLAGVLSELRDTVRPHCVSELAQDTGESMSAISQRLKILFNAKLISRQREGKHVFYHLADDHIRELLDQLFQHASE